MGNGALAGPQATAPILELYQCSMPPRLDRVADRRKARGMACMGCNSNRSTYLAFLHNTDPVLVSERARKHSLTLRPDAAEDWFRLSTIPVQARSHPKGKQSSGAAETGGHPCTFATRPARQNRVVRNRKLISHCDEVQMAAALSVALFDPSD